MDLLIRFRNRNSHPGQYLRRELDAIEVTWDDVDPGQAFVVEGLESVVMGILTDAQAADDVIHFLVL